MYKPREILPFQDGPRPGHSYLTKSSVWSLQQKLLSPAAIFHVAHKAEKPSESSNGCMRKPRDETRRGNFEFEVVIYKDPFMKLIYGTECDCPLSQHRKFSPREGPCSKDLLQRDIANHICQRSSSRRTPSSVFIYIVLSGFIECLLDPAAASRAGQGQISRTLPSPSYTASIQCAERDRERNPLGDSHPNPSPRQ